MSQIQPAVEHQSIGPRLGQLESDAGALASSSQSPLQSVKREALEVIRMARNRLWYEEQARLPVLRQDDPPRADAVVERYVQLRCVLARVERCLQTPFISPKQVKGAVDELAAELRDVWVWPEPSTDSGQGRRAGRADR